MGRLSERAQLFQDKGLLKFNKIMEKLLINGIEADLYDALHNHENVEFTYIKVNGEERVAHGTLKSAIIEENNALPKGKIDNKSDDVLRYFDVDKKAWRSCKKDTIKDDFKIIS